MVTDLISILAFMIAVLVLIVAILTIREAIKQTKQVRKQTKLLRRMLYGEIYKRPPLERVAFLKLKGKYDERVRFEQARGGNLFENVILPKNSRVPLCITWRSKKKQSFRHLSFGFGLGHTKKPRVLKKLPGWTARVIEPLKPLESVDLDGYYHIEYPNPRWAPMKMPFVTELEIETGSGGEYDFRLEICSVEAKEPFEKTLKVIVK